MKLPIVDDDDAVARATGAARATGTARATDTLARRWSLRVSVLEQCSHRCPYCLPSSVQRGAARASWLTPQDHARIAPIFRSRGVAKVRFTGGEPLQRADLGAIIAAWKEAHPAAELALTTNGVRLASMAAELRAVGLARVTVHLDTLRSDRYGALMGDSSPQLVLDALDVARRVFDGVKINMVVQRGKNDDELLDMLDLSRARGVEVRFIELMNTGSAPDYVRDVFMSGADIVARIAQARGAVRVPRRHPSDPATLHCTNDGVTFGVIASDTEPFCGDCDRLRLTVDGRLRGCLYESGGVPLGAALRAGASNAALEALVDAGLAGKTSFHPVAAPHRVRFSMADVGG